MRKQEALALIVTAMLAFILGAILNQDRTPAKKVEPIRVLIPTATPQLVTIEEDKPTYTSEDLACLQQNIYFEARTESIEGQQAVALVTITRTKTKFYPSTICGVVKQLVVRSNGRKVCQFSWNCDGKSDIPNLAHPVERKAWEQAGLVAREVLEGKVKDFLGGATHYHATYVHPSWAKAKRIKMLAAIGAHVFYTDTQLSLRG